jgi:hypothetical protein
MVEAQLGRDNMWHSVRLYRNARGWALNTCDSNGIYQRTNLNSHMSYNMRLIKIFVLQAQPLNFPLVLGAVFV